MIMYDAQSLPGDICDHTTPNTLAQSLMQIIIVVIVKNLFTVGYKTRVYPRPGKLIHTNYLPKYNINYLQKCNILTKIV